MAVKLQYKKLYASSVAVVYICSNVCLSIKALTSSKNNGLTQNQSNPRKSPVMTPRGWGSRAPIDRGYNHSYTSPSSSEVRSNESLQLPSFVGRGYENVPNLSPQQMTQPRYQRAVDARFTKLR